MGERDSETLCPRVMYVWETKVYFTSSINIYHKRSKLSTPRKRRGVTQYLHKLGFTWRDPEIFVITNGNSIWSYMSGVGQNNYEKVINPY